MGRRIMRVPLDFSWPLEKIWEGYTPPDNGEDECPHCIGKEGRATGYSRIGNAIYSLAEGEYRNQIVPLRTEDLVDGEIRFMEALARSAIHKGNRRKDRYRSLGSVTDPRMLCYDLMRHLAKTLRLPFKKTFLCAACKGTASVVVDAEQHKLSRKWREKKPPTGEGWQVWETVSEGSPITPVFATPEELITHICTVGTTWDQHSIAQGWSNRLPSREQATAFVMGPGWVPSMVITTDGQVYRGIESAPVIA